MATLNEVMKDTADAIREKTGKSDLIAPVNFASEIKGITAGGGGADLEGEYFLAKPNGRYWKSKFATMLIGKYPVINNYNGQVFTDEQLEILYGYCTLFALFGYTATYDYGGSPSSGIEVILHSPSEVSKRAGIDQIGLNRYKNGETTFVDCMGSWQECNVRTVIAGGNFEGGLVDFIRLAFGSEIGEMTDDELLTFISEMFMLEQITKEEYESYYNW
jgi:hypothetical protein